MAEPIVLERRRSIRIMAVCMGVLLLLLVPLLLALPFLFEHDRTPVTLGVTLITAMVLLGAGIWLFIASKPHWLSLTMDEDGFTFRRGRTERRYAWSDVSGVMVTRRKNGRTTVPTVHVKLGVKAALYLDDVYTLRPDDLASLIQDRCIGAGNPWPSLPDPVPSRPRRVLRKRWVGWLILPAIALALAGAAFTRVWLDAH